MNFFSIDSKFFHFMSKVADCMILSILWIVFSLPLITAGSATTALYYCAVKVIRRDEGSVLKNFWHSFKTNLKQTILATALLLVVTIAISAIGSMFYATVQTQDALTNIYLVYLIALIFCVAWMHYIFSYIARFQAPLKTILKNSLVICLANLPSSLTMTILLVVVCAGLIMTFPASTMTLLLVPAGYAWITSFLLEKIYGKYTDTDEPVCDEAAQ